MIKYTLIFSILVFTLTACSIFKKSKTTETVLWVNSLRVPCTGLIEMQCLEIQEGEQFASDKWELFYDRIEGFKFRAGYIHKLKIKKENLDPVDVPADGSSIKYTLIEVLEKRSDKKVRLHDIWALKRINGKDIPRGKESGLETLPMLEIYLAEMRFLGNDGCNQIRGELTMATESNLQFGNIAGTKKMCREMNIPKAFRKALAQTATYKLKNLMLILVDENGKELAVLKKMD